MTPRISALGGLRILLIEDDFLIALDTTDLLEAAGAEVLGPIDTIEDAVTFIEHHAERIDGAVLDVNLHGRKSYPVADSLTARSIHFVFTTGYDAGALDEPYRNIPCCQKPFSQTAVVEALLQKPHR